MGWERDYMLNGRPSKTGWNSFRGDFEYGSLDEEDGISFADALKGVGLHIAENVQISGANVTLAALAIGGALYFGPATPDVTEAPVLEDA